jgi:hypothetical protein
MYPLPEFETTYYTCIVHIHHNKNTSTSIAWPRKEQLMPESTLQRVSDQEGIPIKLLHLLDLAAPVRK